MKNNVIDIKKDEEMDMVYNAVRHATKNRRKRDRIVRQRQRQIALEKGVVRIGIIALCMILTVLFIRWGF